MLITNILHNYHEANVSIIIKSVHLVNLVIKSQEKKSIYVTLFKLQHSGKDQSSRKGDNHIKRSCYVKAAPWDDINFRF